MIGLVPPSGKVGAVQSLDEDLDRTADLAIMQNASWGVRTLMACQFRFSTSTVAFVSMLLINLLGCLFFVGIGAWPDLAAPPGIAPGPPVSEIGTLLITPRGKWSPGEVLPLRFLGVGQT